MQVTLPTPIEAALTAEDVRLGLALGLYVSGKLGFGRAAEVAGLSRPQFQQAMAGRRLAMDYSLDDLAEDVAAIHAKAA